MFRENNHNPTSGTRPRWLVAWERALCNPRSRQYLRSVIATDGSVKPCTEEEAYLLTDTPTGEYTKGRWDEANQQEVAMGECLLLALLLSFCWLVVNGMLETPRLVGALGVAVFFIIALWVGNWLDATEYEGEE